MPVSIQDTSPVNWTSCERRFFPCGVCAVEEFCESWLADACCGRGVVFSRTSWACAACGRAAAVSEKPTKNVSFLMRCRILERPSRAGLRSIFIVSRCLRRRKRCPNRVSKIFSARQKSRDAEPVDRLRSETGFLDGVRGGLVNWQYAVEL